jgi:hypothetical protein
MLNLYYICINAIGSVASRKKLGVASAKNFLEQIYDMRFFTILLTFPLKKERVFGLFLSSKRDFIIYRIALK